MTEHPVLAYNIQTGDSRAMTVSDFLSRSQFHRLGLYNEFFRLLGVEDGLSFALSVSPSRVIGLGLLRRSWRTFTKRDRQLLNLLRPHLIQAYHNAVAVTRMQQELALVQQEMARLERGMIVLSREGQVQLLTERAQQWLAAYFGRAAGTTDRLPEVLQRWVRHQQDLYKAAEMPGPRTPLVVERDGARLVVRLVEEAEYSFLLLEEQQTGLHPAALAALGLSQRQAEVLTWVAQGRSNYAIGVLLGCSEGTVKKHLEHIYAKLGVWNRTEAAAQALAVAASPSQYTRRGAVNASTSGAPPPDTAVV
jgi:DNA-binding CsgD family transcriptional regulator